MAFGAVPTWSLGDRLRKALEHADLRAGDMAEYLDVSRNTIGNYMAGRVKVPEAVILAWSMRTGVPPGWLKSGVADPAPVARHRA